MSGVCRVMSGRYRVRAESTAWRLDRTLWRDDSPVVTGRSHSSFCSRRRDGQATMSVRSSDKCMRTSLSCAAAEATILRVDDTLYRTFAGQRRRRLHPSAPVTIRTQ